MSSSSRVVRRQPRGSINKRACENCRRLKIRCDGDAERSTDCSNCEVGTCVFDKSPRKNRQVEKLNNQVTNLETSLEKIQNDLQLQTQQTAKLEHTISVLKQEKEIQGLLHDYHSYFHDCQENQVVFEQLKQIIGKSQCWSILLPLMRELLLRLSQNTTETASIINALKMIAENTVRFCQPGSSFNSMMTPPPELMTSTVLSNVNANPYHGDTSPSELISPTMMVTLQSPINQQEITPHFSDLNLTDLFYFSDMNDNSL